MFQQGACARTVVRGASWNGPTFATDEWRGTVHGRRNADGEAWKSPQGCQKRQTSRKKVAWVSCMSRGEARGCDLVEPRRRKTSGARMKEQHVEDEWMASG